MYEKEHLSYNRTFAIVSDPLTFSLSSGTEWRVHRRRWKLCLMRTSTDCRCIGANCSLRTQLPATLARMSARRRLTSSTTVSAIPPPRPALTSQYTVSVSSMVSTCNVWILLHPHLFPLLCGFDVALLPPSSAVLHPFARQSLLSQVVLHAVHPSPLQPSLPSHYHHSFTETFFFTSHYMTVQL